MSVGIEKSLSKAEAINKALDRVCNRIGQIEDFINTHKGEAPAPSTVEGDEVLSSPIFPVILNLPDCLHTAADRLDRILTDLREALD